MTACIRGCTLARRHLDSCEDDDCRGCQPREADHGRLCGNCHTNLVDMLDTAPKQHRLLLAMTEPVVAPDYTATDLHKIGDGWRTDSEQTFRGPYAHRQPASEGSEPIRLEALAVAQELADMLSAWVEDLCEQVDLHGPAELRTAGERHGRVQVTHYREEEYAPEYVWREPPRNFEVGSACRWLVAQVAQLEALEYVGDLVEELAMMMSRGHALAPWRREAAKLRGIECPTCHTKALVRFGGHDYVTCLRCNGHMGWERYWIWVRMLTQRAKGETREA